jgi:hypothetical protein
MEIDGGCLLCPASPPCDERAKSSPPLVGWRAGAWSRLTTSFVARAVLRPAERAVAELALVSLLLLLLFVGWRGSVGSLAAGDGRCAGRHLSSCNGGHAVNDSCAGCGWVCGLFLGVVETARRATTSSARRLNDLGVSYGRLVHGSVRPHREKRGFLAGGTAGRERVVEVNVNWDALDGNTDYRTCTVVPGDDG